MLLRLLLLLLLFPVIIIRVIWDDRLVLISFDLVVNSLESDDILFNVAVACWMEEMVHVELLLFSRSSICDWIIFHSSCSFVASIDDDMVMVCYMCLCCVET